jgi:hypothetical protein
MPGRRRRHGLADGRELSVVKAGAASREQDFLREVFLGACRYFTTVLALGPIPSTTTTSHDPAPRRASAASASR